MSTEISTTDRADFKQLKAAAVAALEKSADNYKEFIGHLKEIHRRELWRVEAKSMNEFLDNLAQDMGASRRTFYRWLRAEAVRDQLTKQVQCHSVTKDSKSLAKTIKNITPKALLEVAKEPPDHRLKVIEEASKQSTGQPPTAAAISAAAKVKSEGRKATDKSTWPKDCEGTPIPPPAWPFWERRNEVQPWLNQISEIKCAIEKAKKSGDSLYAWIGTPAIDALQNAFTTIGNAKLYAVCTKCQGWWDRMSGGGCSACHNTGLISKHQYDVCSPAEIKRMREASNKRAQQ
jgi:hypothetical protein